MNSNDHGFTQNRRRESRDETSSATHHQICRISFRSQTVSLAKCGTGVINNFFLIDKIMAREKFCKNIWIVLEPNAGFRDEKPAIKPLS